MIKTSVCLLCGTLSLYLAVSIGTKVFAADSVAPVRMDRDKMAGLGLTAIPPDAYKDILVAGELNMRVAPCSKERNCARPSSSQLGPKRITARDQPMAMNSFMC